MLSELLLISLVAPFDLIANKTSSTLIMSDKNSFSMNFTHKIAIKIM